MADLEDFADQGTPLLTDLDAAAPALGRLIKAQGTLADASREAFPSLGDALERGRPALIRRAAADPGPRASSASSSTPVSVEPRRAHEEPRRRPAASSASNDLLYYLALVTNGFDALGHYLRAGLVTNLCSTYALEQSVACRAHFFDPAPRPPSASGAPRAGQRRREPPDAARRQRRPDRHACCSDLLGQGARRGRPRARAQPRALRERAASGSRRRSTAPRPGSTTCSGARPVSPRRRTGRAHGEPGAGGRRDGAGHDRRRLPLLQRELGPAVRAHLRPEGEPAERRPAREGLRGADRRRAGGLHLEDRAAAAARTARPTRRSR